MGSGSSKPEASAGSRHVFSSSSPIQFSSNIVDALQSSGETDSSRAKTLELQIQERVAEELERLRKREQQTLSEIEKRLAEIRDEAIPPPSAPTTTTAAAPISHTPGSLNLDAPRIPFAGREYTPVAAPQDKPVDRSLTRESVNSEIEALRTKLEGRSKLMKLDDGVEKAKADVVSCLRMNDRRPLDCWKEVDEFKSQVARMEEAFVDRIVG